MRQYNKNKTVCPVCKHDNPECSIRSVGKYDIEKCLNCGLEYVYPMPTEKELAKFYFNYSDIRAQDEVLRINAGNNIKKLSKYGLRKSSKLLDFGCGKNIFVERANSKTWFGYDGYSENSEKTVQKYESQAWDFITMWGVLEHLADPLGQVQKLVSSLKAKGIIAITTVTIESSIPFQYKPPEHLTYWTEESIAELFRFSGLKMLDYSSYKMIQNSDVYLQCVLRTVPDRYKAKIFHKLPKYVSVPTNEIFVIGEKQ